MGVVAPQLTAVFLLLVVCQRFSAGVANVAFVVLSQASDSVDVARDFRRNVDLQARRLPDANFSYRVHLLHEDWPTVVGAWTVFPIVNDLVSRHEQTRPWIFICQEATRVRLQELSNILRNFDADQEHFVGKSLQDAETTIIHHFAPADGPNALQYPDSAAGLIFNFGLLERIAGKVASGDAKLPEFSIDPMYELANFIRVHVGVRLRDSRHLCVRDGPGCVTRYEPTPPCISPVPSGDIFFAVKTCSRFHDSRVPIVKTTWGKAAANIAFYSDASDPLVPTVRLGIPNTENGHCAKTLAILENALRAMQAGNMSWLVVTDDDTLLSVRRLREFLGCRDASRPAAIGERYGYGTARGAGFDYVTGGGGMVFSKPLVELLVGDRRCRCPSADSPDDMFLGSCLRSLRVPIAHSPLFHQARPADYHRDLLLRQDPVSFHKHWMIDPTSVYLEWLSSRDHDEL